MAGSPAPKGPDPRCVAAVEALKSKSEDAAKKLHQAVAHIVQSH